MEVEILYSGYLRLPWIAGTRIKSLSKNAIQKCQIPTIIQDMIKITLSPKIMGILLYGLCLIAKKHKEFIEEDLIKFLNASLSTPIRIKNNENLAQINGELIKSSLKYSGGNFKSIPHTPPSLEQARAGHFTNNNSIIIDDLKIHQNYHDEFFKSITFIDNDISLNQMTIPMSLENIDEILSPTISPKNQIYIKTISTKKSKKKWNDENTLQKVSLKPLTRKFEKWQPKRKEFDYPEELKKFIEEFSGYKPESTHKIVAGLDDDIVENIQISSEKNVEIQQNYNIQEITPVQLNFSYDLEASRSPDRVITPVKNTQILKFEERLISKVKTGQSCSFSKLIEGENRTNVSKALSCLLTLTFTKEVNLYQKKPFGEILITRIAENDR